MTEQWKQSWNMLTHDLVLALETESLEELNSSLKWFLLDSTLCLPISMWLLGHGLSTDHMKMNKFINNSQHIEPSALWVQCSNYIAHCCPTDAQHSCATPSSALTQLVNLISMTVAFSSLEVYLKGHNSRKPSLIPDWDGLLSTFEHTHHSVVGFLLFLLYFCMYDFPDTNSVILSGSRGSTSEEQGWCFSCSLL